jgi:phosphoribosyl 1,2-cyclic phosphate phosphodiesterase
VKLRVLGSGASSGTPAIDWGWGLCDPRNPKNVRTRPSILVETDDTRLLVDTPPELREQLIAAAVSTVDAVVYTHSHADHLHGIDDLRAINRARMAPLDAYADAQTLEVIRTRFSYVLEPLVEGASFYYKPTLVPHVVADGESFMIGSILVTAFEQSHGFSTTLGFRFGSAAYTTDVVELPEHAFDILQGVETWIIGTLVDRPHKTHCDVDQALEWIRRINPRRAILSHLGSDLDYATLLARLPEGVEPAYDGMMVEVCDPRSPS